MYQFLGGKIQDCVATFACKQITGVSLPVGRNDCLKLRKKLHESPDFSPDPLGKIQFLNK